jgi:uncharacterized membrane protein YbhN (UPF0104 family)
MNNITVEIIRDIRIPFRSHIMLPRHAVSDSTRIVEHSARNAYSVLRRIVALTVVAFAIWAMLSSTSQLRKRHLEIESERAQLQSQRDLYDRADATAADIALRVSLDDKLRSLQAERIIPQNFSWLGIACGTCSYGVALIVSAMFWWNCLRAFHQPATIPVTIAAHVLGQIGKYIPGKAMVIVMRTAATARHDGVAKIPAVLSVFVETLTMMACGAAVAGVAALAIPAPTWVRLGAFAFGCCAAIPTIPPLFRPILARVASTRFLRDSHLTSHDYSWRLMVHGWLWMLLVWLLIAISFWFIVRATPGAHTNIIGFSGFATTTATISLAMIAGFVSFVPGGAGVRELVITGILAPVAGAGPAMVAAILARLVFLLVECLASSLAWLYLHRTDSRAPIKVN